MWERKKIQKMLWTQFLIFFGEIITYFPQIETEMTILRKYGA